MTPRTFLALSLLASLAISPASARTVRFQINASYQGGISMDFGRIGETTLTFDRCADGGVRVTGTGKVNHPREKTKVLEFGLDMGFRVEGNWIRTLESRNTSNEAGAGLLAKIERILPFLHVASLVPVGEGVTQRSYFSRQGVLNVTARRTGDAVEVVIEDGPRTLASFYLKNGALSHFTAPTKEGALLTFTADQPLAFAAVMSGRQ